MVSMRIEDKANINQQIDAQQKASDDLLQESGVSGSAPADAEKKAELGQAADLQNIVAKLIENAELSSENKESGVEKLEKATEQSFNQAEKGESWQNYAETSEAKSLPASVEDIKAQEKNEESAKEEQVRAQEMLAQLTIQSGKIPG
jgi:hypothetical protein